MGWARPLVFAPAGAPTASYTWGRPEWLPWCLDEQRATRERVAVFDQTSFSLYDVTGPDALASLQWICAADVDVPVGGCVYTPFLAERGTYEADLTVTRTGGDSFLLVSSSATTIRDLDWIRRHLAPGSDVTVRDRTDELSVIGVMGPRSRDLLGRVSAGSTADGRSEWSDEAFPFATSRQVRVGGVDLRATRMTYVGEVGWELVVPVEHALTVYDALQDAGTDLGRADAGYHAIESMRLEKGYRAFGRDLNPDLTPVEAGLVFATGLDQLDAGGHPVKDFLGRAALAAHRDRLRAPGDRRRLVSFVASDPRPMVWGGELLLRDGAPAGQVTSAAYGATVGASVGLALLRSDRPVRQQALDESSFAVDLAGELVPVRVTLAAPLR
jgi:4-methylaminobutanoate oxidase (formaldehyde-forming)